MKNFKNVSVIDGKLATLIDDYVREFRETGEGFEEFSDEAILYSLLEYSKFPRVFTKKERIIYVHGKCLEYHGQDHYYVDVHFDPASNAFYVVSEKFMMKF